MGPPSYMRPVVDRNVVMRRMNCMCVCVLYIYIHTHTHTHTYKTGRREALCRKPGDSAVREILNAAWNYGYCDQHVFHHRTQ